MVPPCLAIPRIAMRGKIDDGGLDHAAPAVQESNELVTVDGNAFEHGAADHRIQTGAVATAGQNSDFHVSTQIVGEGLPEHHAVLLRRNIFDTPLLVVPQRRGIAGEAS
ncbi:hypothetical protein MAUB1S_03592 [Mycolicibacterium aubagnense]